MNGAVEASGFEAPIPILNSPFVEPRNAGTCAKANRGGLAEVKAQAAHRWCAAVNASGEFGHWDYKLAFNVAELEVHLVATSWGMRDSSIALPGN